MRKESSACRECGGVEVWRCVVAIVDHRGGNDTSRRDLVKIVLLDRGRWHDGSLHVAESIDSAADGDAYTSTRVSDAAAPCA